MNKRNERIVEDSDAACGWRDCSCMAPNKNSKKKKKAYLGWRTGLFTAMLYIRIQVLSGMSSTSENKQLIQLPCIPLWKCLHFKVFFEFHKSRKKCHKKIPTMETCGSSNLSPGTSIHVISSASGSPGEQGVNKSTIIFGLDTDGPFT